ncbi:hypothetical protein GW17_00014200 [Ensete ventricosum]|nr:hypothetical protein GW17_00014200 [Ensete ventricosum]
MSQPNRHTWKRKKEGDKDLRNGTLGLNPRTPEPEVAVGHAFLAMSGGETRRRRRRAGGGWDYEPEGQRTTRRGDMVGAAAAAEATLPDAAELSSFPVDTKTWVRDKEAGEK